MPIAHSDLAIIVPCYNEAKRLQKDKFLDYGLKNKDIDLWFANDGSTDDTLLLIQEIAALSKGNIRVFDVQPNGGKAEVIRKTILYLLQHYHYNGIGFIDADLSAPLEEISPLYDTMVQNNLKIISGARVKLVGKVIHRSEIRHYLGRIFATYYDSLLKLRNYDTQCGLKIFRPDFAVKIFAESFQSNWFFDIELFVRAKKLLGREQYYIQTAEQPLNEWKEVKGSRLKITDFLKAPFEVLKIYRKYR